MAFYRQDIDAHSTLRPTLCRTQCRRVKAPINIDRLIQSRGFLFPKRVFVCFTKLIRIGNVGHYRVHLANPTHFD